MNKKQKTKLIKITAISSILTTSPILIATTLTATNNNNDFKNYKLTYNQILRNIDQKINSNIGTYGFYNNDPKMEIFFGQGATNKEYSNINSHQFGYSTAPINATTNLTKTKTIFTQQLGTLGFDVVGTTGSANVETDTFNTSSAFWNPNHKRHTTLINEIKSTLNQMATDLTSSPSPTQDQIKQSKVIADYLIQTSDKKLINTLSKVIIDDTNGNGLKSQYGNPSNLIYPKESFMTSNDLPSDLRSAYNSVLKSFCSQTHYLKKAISTIDAKYSDAINSSQYNIKTRADIIVGYDSSLKTSTFNSISSSISGMNISQQNKEQLASIVAKKLNNLHTTIPSSQWWALQESIITDNEILNILKSNNLNIESQLSQRVDAIINQFTRPSTNSIPTWAQAQKVAKNSISSFQIKAESQEFAMTFFKSNFLSPQNKNKLFDIGSNQKLIDDPSKSIWSILFNTEDYSKIQNVLNKINSIKDLFYWSLTLNYQYTLPAIELQTLKVDIADGIILNQEDGSKIQLSDSQYNTIKQYFELKVPFDPDFSTLLSDIQTEKDKVQSNIVSLKNQLNQEYLQTGQTNNTLFALINDESQSLFKLSTKENIVLALTQLLEAAIQSNPIDLSNIDFLNYITIKYGTYQDVINSLNVRESFLRKMLSEQRDDILTIMIGATQGDYSLTAANHFKAFFTNAISLFTGDYYDTQTNQGKNAISRSTKFTTNHLAVTESYFATISEMAIRIGYASLFQSFLDQLKTNSSTGSLNFLIDLYRNENNSPSIEKLKKTQELNSIASQVLIDVFYNFVLAINQNYNIASISYSEDVFSDDQKILTIQKFIENAWKDLAISANAAFSGQNPNWSNASNLFNAFGITTTFDQKEQDTLKLFVGNQSVSDFTTKYSGLMSMIESSSFEELNLDNVKNQTKNQIKQALITLPIDQLAFTNSQNKLDNITTQIINHIFNNITSLTNQTFSSNLQTLKSKLTSLFKNDFAFIYEYFNSTLSSVESFDNFVSSLELAIVDSLSNYSKLAYDQAGLKNLSISGQSMIKYLILILIENQMDITAFYNQYKNGSSVTIDTSFYKYTSPISEPTGLKSANNNFFKFKRKNNGSNPEKDWFIDHNVALTNSLYGSLESSFSTYATSLDNAYKSNLEPTDPFSINYITIDSSSNATISSARGDFLRDSGFTTNYYNITDSSSVNNPQVITKVSAQDKASYLNKHLKNSVWYNKVSFGGVASAYSAAYYGIHLARFGGSPTMLSNMISLKKAYNASAGTRLSLWKFSSKNFNDISNSLNTISQTISNSNSSKFTKIFKRKTSIKSFAKAQDYLNETTNFINKAASSFNVADVNSYNTAKTARVVMKQKATKVWEAIKAPKRVIKDFKASTAALKRSQKALLMLKKSFSAITTSFKTLTKAVTGFFKTNPFMLVAGFLLDGILNFVSYEGGTFSYYQELNPQSLEGINQIYAYASPETLNEIMNNLLLNSPYEFNNQKDESYLELLSQYASDNSQVLTNSSIAKSLFAKVSDGDSAAAIQRFQNLLQYQTQSFKQGLYYNATDWGASVSPSSITTQGKMATTFIDLGQSFNSFVQNNTSVYVESFNSLGWINSDQIYSSKQNNIFTSGTFDNKAAYGAGGFFTKFATEDLLQGMSSLSIATRNQISLSEIGISSNSTPTPNTIYTHQMTGSKINLGTQKIFGKTQAQNSFDKKNRWFNWIPLFGKAISANRANSSGSSAFELTKSETPTIVTFPYLTTEVVNELISQANGGVETDFQHNLFGYSTLTLKLVQLPNGNAALAISQDILDHGSSSYSLKDNGTSVPLSLMGLSAVSRVMVQQSSIVPNYILDYLLKEDDGLIAQTFSSINNLSINLVDDLGFPQSENGLILTGKKIFDINNNFRYSNSTIQKLVNNWENLIKDKISALTKEEVGYRDPIIQTDINTLFDQIKDTLSTIYISKVIIEVLPTGKIQISLQFSFAADITGTKSQSIETTTIDTDFTFKQINVQRGVVDKVNELFIALSLKNSSLNGNTFNTYSIINDFKNKNQSDLKLLEQDYLIWIKKNKLKEILNSYLTLWNNWINILSSNLTIANSNSFTDLQTFIDTISSQLEDDSFEFSLEKITSWDNEFSRLISSNGISEDLAVQYLSESIKLQTKYNINFLDEEVQNIFYQDYLSNPSLATTESKIKFIASELELGYANGQVMVDKYNHSNTNNSKEITLDIAASDIFSISFNTTGTIFDGQNINVSFEDLTNNQKYEGKPQADGNYIWNFATTNYESGLTFSNFNTENGQATPKEYKFTLDATNISDINSIFKINIKQKPSTFANVDIKNNQSTDYLVNYPYSKKYLLIWTPDFKNLPPYYQWTDETFKNLQNENKLSLIFGNNPDDLVKAAFERNGLTSADAEVISYNAAIELKDESRWESYVIENPFQILKNTKNKTLQTINDIYVVENIDAQDVFYISQTNKTSINTWQPNTFLDITFLQQSRFALGDQLSNGDKIVWGEVDPKYNDDKLFGLLKESTIKSITKSDTNTNLVFNLKANTLYKLSISKQVDNEVVWFNKYVYYSQAPVLSLADPEFKTSLIQSYFKTNNIFTITPFELSTIWFKILHTQRIIGQGASSINLEEQIKEFTLSQILSLIQSQTNTISSSNQNALQEAIYKRDLIEQIKSMVQYIEQNLNTSIFDSLKNDSLDSYLKLFNTSQLQALQASISQKNNTIVQTENQIIQNNQTIKDNTYNLSILKESYKIIESLLNINHPSITTTIPSPSQITDLILNQSNNSWLTTSGFLKLFVEQNENSTAFWNLISTMNSLPAPDSDNDWIKRTIINLLNQALVSILESQSKDILYIGSKSAVDYLSFDNLFTSQESSQKTPYEYVQKWSQLLQKINTNSTPSTSKGTIDDLYIGDNLGDTELTTPINNWITWKTKFNSIFKQNNNQNTNKLLISKIEIDKLSSSNSLSLNSTEQNHKDFEQLSEALLKSSVTDNNLTGYVKFTENIDSSGNATYKISTEKIHDIYSSLLTNSLYIDLSKIVIEYDGSTNAKQIKYLPNAINVGPINSAITLLKQNFVFADILIAQKEGSMNLMANIISDEQAKNFIKYFNSTTIQHNDFFTEKIQSLQNKNASLAQFKKMLEAAETPLIDQFSLNSLAKFHQSYISTLTNSNSELEQSNIQLGSELDILKQDLADLTSQYSNLVSSGTDIYAMLSTIFASETIVYNKWVELSKNSTTFLENLKLFKTFLEEQIAQQKGKTKLNLTLFLELTNQLIAIEEKLVQIQEIEDPMFYQSTTDSGVMRDLASYLLTNIREVSLDKILNEILGITNWRSHINSETISTILQSSGKWTFEEVKDFDDKNHIIYIKGSVSSMGQPSKTFIISIPLINKNNPQINNFVIYWAKQSFIDDNGLQKWNDAVLSTNLVNILKDKELASKYFEQNLIYDQNQPTIANKTTTIFKSTPQLSKYIFIDKKYSASIDSTTTINNPNIYDSVLEEFRSFLLKDINKMLSINLISFNDPKYSDFAQVPFKISQISNTEDNQSFSIESLTSKPKTFTFNRAELDLTDQQWNDLINTLTIKSNLSIDEILSVSTLSTQATNLLKPIISETSQVISLSMKEFTEIVLPNLGLTLNSTYNDVFLSSNKNLLSSSNSVLLKLSHNNSSLDVLQNEKYILLRLKAEISSIGLEPWVSNEFSVLIKKSVNINSIITNVFELTDSTKSNIFEQLVDLMNNKMSESFISTFELRSTLSNNSKSQKLNYILASLISQAPYIANIIPETNNSVANLLEIKDANGKIINLEYKVSLFRSILPKTTTSKLSSILDKTNPSNDDLFLQIKNVLIEDKILSFTNSSIAPEGFVSNTINHIYGSQYISTPDFSNLNIEFTIVDPNDPIKRGAKNKGLIHTPLSFDGKTKYIVFKKDVAGNIYTTTSTTKASTKLGSLINSQSNNYHFNNALIKSILPQLQVLYDEILATASSVYEASSENKELFILNTQNPNEVTYSTNLSFELSQEDILKSNLISQSEFNITADIFQTLTNDLKFDTSIDSINKFLHQFVSRLIQKFTSAPSNSISVLKNIKQISNKYILVIDNFSGDSYSTIQFAIDTNLANSPINFSNWKQLGIKNQSVEQIQEIFGDSLISQYKILDSIHKPLIDTTTSNINIQISGHSAFGSKKEKVSISDEIAAKLPSNFQLATIPTTKEKVEFFKPWMWALLIILTAGIILIGARIYFVKRSKKSTSQI